MLGVNGVGDSSFLDDPGSKFLYGKLGKAGRKERSKERRERVSKQPSSTAEIR
jgi:hypothetical protein